MKKDSSVLLLFGEFQVNPLLIVAEVDVNMFEDPSWSFISVLLSDFSSSDPIGEWLPFSCGFYA